MEFYDLFKKANGMKFGPYPFQLGLAKGQNLPKILEIPTGAGKTASVVLAWIWRRCFAPPEIRKNTPRRLIYCLPMRVLVEQIHDNIRQWINNLGDIFPDGEKPKLTKLMGGEIESDEGDWANYPEKNAIIVGTQDMLLSRALNRGYGSAPYRWPKDFGIINNDCLWIIDEVQLMGTGLATTAQLQAFRKMFGAIGETGTLWMSATLDKQWLKTVDFNADHEISGDERAGLKPEDLSHPHLSCLLNAKKTLDRATSTMDETKNLANEVMTRHEEALKKQKNGIRTIVVLNTVRRAVDLYKEAKNLIKKENRTGINLALIHSRFRPVERAAILKRALAPVENDGTIIITTQVIEAGVDISSCTLFTDLAPWASLVQRFGRCNRKGEYEEARVFWMDVKDPEKLKSGKNDEALPYSVEDMVYSRSILEKIGGMINQNVSPSSLKKIQEAQDIKLNMPQGLVLRKKDLLELFDTTPDLTGMDIDISRFIREADEFNVQVFWRDLKGEKPSDEEPRPLRDELCPAPVNEVRKLVDKTAFWKWSHLDGRWEKIEDKSEIIPGITLLVDSKEGKYSTEIGWDKVDKDYVKPIDIKDSPPAVAQESYEGDELSSMSPQKDWMTIAKHTDMVVERVKKTLGALPVSPVFQEQILEAARWHDAGKAHEVFQKTMRGWNKTNRAFTSEPPSHLHNRLLAKCPAHGQRHERPGFRHGLASGIMALMKKKSDLTAYLAAAHHGKVRLSIRSFLFEDKPDNEETRFARGVWEGDHIPPICLKNGEKFDKIDLGGGVVVDPLEIDLSYMDLGDTNGKESWLSRMLHLRDSEDIGPFRLALFENIMKAADERASGGME